MNGLKKNLQSLNIKEKLGLITLGVNGLSIRQQCELIDLNRSNLYYQPIEIPEETIQIMHKID